MANIYIYIYIRVRGCPTEHDSLAKLDALAGAFAQNINACRAGVVIWADGSKCKGILNPRSKHPGVCIAHIPWGGCLQNHTAI